MGKLNYEDSVLFIVIACGVALTALVCGGMYVLKCFGVL